MEENEASNSDEPIIKEFEKLITVSDLILEKVNKNESPKKEFRIFKLKSSERFDGIRSELEKLDGEISLVWNSDTTFNEILIGNQIKISFPGDRRKANLNISEIFKLSLSRAKNEIHDENIISYPDILRSKLLKILNLIRSDSRYQNEIDKLDTILEKHKNKGKTPEIPKKNVMNTPFGTFDMDQIMSNMPEEFQGLAGGLMGSAPQMAQLAQKMMRPEIMSQLGKGDFKGFAKKMAKDEDIKKQMANLGPALNPLIQKTAKLFKDNKKNFPTEIPDNTEDITIEKIFENVEKTIENMDDDSDEHAEEVSEAWLKEKNEEEKSEKLEKVEGSEEN